MPENVVKQLFQRYKTFDNKSGHNKHGCGLGLVIC